VLREIYAEDAQGEGLDEALEEFSDQYGYNGLTLMYTDGRVLDSMSSRDRSASESSPEEDYKAEANRQVKRTLDKTQTEKAGREGRLRRERSAESRGEILRRGTSSNQMDQASGSKQHQRVRQQQSQREEAYRLRILRDEIQEDELREEILNERIRDDHIKKDRLDEDIRKEQVLQEGIDKEERRTGEVSADMIKCLLEGGG
jgi:hypothetical protein